MIKKGIILGAASIAIVGAGVYSFSALAAPQQGQFGPNYTAERHEAMTKAFENNDYNAWKAQMGSRGATQKVTEQNFERFSQMHKLMLEGKTEEANKIRTELGLGQGKGRGQGMMNGQHGQGRGGNFSDKNGDGVCDRMQK